MPFPTEPLPSPCSRNDHQLEGRKSSPNDKRLETTLQDYLITTKIAPVQSKELFVLFSMFENFVYIFQ